MGKKYVAEPTARLFHGSDKFFRGLRGPVGCGKTVACCMEVYTRALEQAPYEGVRRSRWAFVRNTYPELLSTTLKTWQDWVPDSACHVTRGAMISGMLRVELGDGTRVEAEIIFLALDREEDIGKLQSLELTGVFLNESSQIRKSILDMATTRVGRYPNQAQGGITWTGLIADTNSPDDDHWWYKLAEVSQPEDYRFFDYPPAAIRIPAKNPDEPPEFVMNDGTHGIPAAENIDNLHGGFLYYRRILGGKSEDWIRVYVMNEYGSLYTGKPVYPEFSDKLHVAKDGLKAVRGIPLILAWDFGLTPACVFMQETLRGQMMILDECVSEDMGVERFARDIVQPKLRADFQGMGLVSVGDPAGAGRAQSDETTCFQLLDMAGIPTVSAPSNKFQIRREAVAFYLTKLTDGVPGFVVDKKAAMCLKGFRGRYMYRKVRSATDTDRFTEIPEKNDVSHPHDAIQYGCSWARSAAILASERRGLGGPGSGKRRNFKNREII